MQSFKIPKSAGAALLIVEGYLICYFTVSVVLINLLNRKLKQMFLWVGLLLLELNCFKNIVLSYNLRILPHAFMRR